MSRFTEIKNIQKHRREVQRIAKYNIKNATVNHCVMKRRRAEYETFALWIIAKKLEAKGFKCELDYYELNISWE